MDFQVPEEIRRKVEELDAFIEREIAPLERANIQFFDHRREHARTDWEHGGRPRREWEELLREMRRRADAAGHLRFGLLKELGGQGGSNLAMAIIREHLAARGLGLHNALQIYRHHRRYRITEGSEEIQIRRVAGVLFGKRARH